MNIYSIPEAGPLDPPSYDLPDCPDISLTDEEILQHIGYCRNGDAETAFGQDKEYWDKGIVDDWAAEWDKENGADRILDKSWSHVRIECIHQLMVLHARWLLKNQRVPIELLEEEGLI